MFISIRGASTVELNDGEAVREAAAELLSEIIEMNNINTDDIVSILFSCTRDLNKAYPAAAAREMGITRAALMCFDELYVEGSLPMCLRVMVSALSDKKQSEALHIYQRGAKILRPDITAGERAHFSIAIDGPGGAGKSTVARLCAERLGFSYIDTGAMYRAFTYYCLKSGIDVADREAIDGIVTSAPILVKFIGGQQHVFSEGEDISDKIRTNEISQAASKISTIPSVRRWLVDMQRGLSKNGDVVMDGRDIGTVVLKESPLKIYLDASPEIRAKRRQTELLAAGEQVCFTEILEEIRERDHRDMNREADPLKKAPDAVVIDTGAMSADEVCAVICALARKRMANRPRPA